MALLDDFREVWTKHEEEFQTAMTECRGSTSNVQIQSKADLPAAMAAVTQAKQYLTECEKAYSSLDSEVRKNPNLAGMERTSYRSQLKSLRSDMESERRRLRELEVGVRQAELGQGDLLERQALLQGSNVIDSITNATNQSKQVLAETEDIALTTSTQLYEQGDQMDRTLNTLHETNALSDRARRIMIGMARRMYTDRIIQFIIVLIEITIIGIVVWWKFFSKK